MRRAIAKRTGTAAALLALLGAAAAGCAEGEAYWLFTTTTAATTTIASTTTAVTTTTAATTTTIAADALRVAPDGSGDASDLASALAAIAPGGTILLEAGVHTLAGPVVVEIPVTIVGRGSDLTTMIGERGPEVLRFTGPGPHTLQGITLRYGGAEAADGLVVEEGTVALTDVQVVGAVRTEESGGSGFVLAGRATGAIDACTARDNGYHGFDLRDAADLQITDTIAAGNGAAGFAWSGQARGTAANDTARANGLSGFVVLGRARPRLIDNLAEENADNGFLFKGTSRAVLAGNIARRNGWSAFRWLEQAAGTAQANMAEDNTDGFWIADEAAPTLIGNTSHGHRSAAGNGAGLVYSGTGGGAARRNVVYDNDWGLALAADASPLLEDNDIRDNTANRVNGVTFG